MVIVVAQYYGRPSTSAEVREALGRMAALVHEHEPGCLMFQVGQGLDAPDEWVIYEVYRDRDALQAHRDSAHFASIIVGEVIPLLERRVPNVYELVIS